MIIHNWRGVGVVESYLFLFPMKDNIFTRLEGSHTGVTRSFNAEDQDSWRLSDSEIQEIQTWFE